MNVYKAKFSGNDILYCSFICESASDFCAYYCNVEDNKANYAIIKAETAQKARLLARNLITTHRTKGLS
jgi:hypothetical protein